MIVGNFMDVLARGFRDLLIRTDLDEEDLKKIPARANINNQAIYEFFCKRNGVPLELILAGTKTSPAEFLNEKLWTDPVAARTHDINAVEAFPGFFHHRNGFEEGRAFLDVMPNLHILYFRLLPIRSILKQLDRANAKFNNEYRLEAFRIRPGSALIALTPYPYRVSSLVGQECHFIRGVLHANFSLHGVREVEITERYCSTPLRSLVNGVYRWLDPAYQEKGDSVLMNGHEIARRVVLAVEEIEGHPVYKPSRADTTTEFSERNGIRAYQITKTFRHDGHVLFQKGEIYGAPHCLLEVTWRDSSPLAALLNRIRTPLSTRRVTLREMRRQIEHSNLQFFELLEQKRRTIEALESADKHKDDFLSRTAHDLRTPLNGIIGLMETAGKRLGEGETVQAERSLELALAAAQGLSHLVNDILDYAKLRNNSLSLQYRVVDLRSVLLTTVETVQPLLDGKDVHLELRSPERETTRIQADENRLFQVFFNLLGNAVKFTEHGTIKVNSYREGDHVVVEVSDTGIGIPPEDLSSVFETYAQVSSDHARSYGGMGIGLSVVRRIVEMHGGSVTVQSEQNTGSTFTVRLPVGDIDAEVYHQACDPPAVHEVSPKAREGRTRESTTQIWACDDDVLNLEVMDSILSDEGYSVRRFRRGETLLKCLSNDPGRHPAVVLLDVMMPGIGGLQTCRLIRERCAPPELPVIMVTARSFPEDLQAGFEAGASDYVTKPIVRQELLARTRLHLSLSRAFAAQKLHQTRLRLLDTILTLIGYVRGTQGAESGRTGDIERIVEEIRGCVESSPESRDSSALRDALALLANEHIRLSRDLTSLSTQENDILDFPAILEKVLEFVRRSTSNGVTVNAESLGLSAREAQVVEAVCLGYGNSEIASKLAITENTVKRHLYNAYNKLGVDSRAQLAYKILVDRS